MLKDLDLKYVYDTSNNDLIEDLFEPLLNESIYYLRGVGYFTSGWLELVSRGLTKLVLNNGKGKIITSPNLSKKDWSAMKNGEEAKKNRLLYKKLNITVENLEESLSDNTLSALSWLIADEIIEFKFAVPKNNIGDYHNKLACFKDENGNWVVLHGSYNDSKHGLLNGESFSVFCSWKSSQKNYITHHLDKINKIWNDENNFFEIYRMPKAIKNKIIKYTENYDRPYKYNKEKNMVKIGVPSNISLRPYQNKAMENWFKNENGILEMATGTGKTFTALAITSKFIEKYNKAAFIVSVPYSQLVKQWKNEAKKFGYSTIMCRGSKNKWIFKLRSLIQNYNLGFNKNLFIITTHSTASNSPFISLAKKIKNNVFFIGDECHYLGAKKLSKALVEDYEYRLGLSATPHRWFDKSGTKKIISYFGQTILKYNIKKAISNNFLTEYKYFPILVELNQKELTRYKYLSKKISNIIYKLEKKEQNKSEYLETLIRKRSNVIKKAENKFNIFKRLINDNFNKNMLKNTIVFCPVGEINKVHRILLDFNLDVRKIDYKTTPSMDDKMKIINMFQNGIIDVILAMKCLDEGVDIPSVENAYILASTSNPREFIQRRGRVLRNFNGKDLAYIYDFIIVPPDGTNKKTAESILRKEMPRFVEMSIYSENEYDSRMKIVPVLKKYNLEDLSTRKPWDVYKENREIKDEI